MMRTRKLSQKQEKEIAGILLGQIVPASGAVPHGGSDVRKQGELTIECKYTSKKSYSLKLGDLQKVKAVAIRNGAEKPLMTIRFVDKHGRSIEEVVVMSLTHFEELYAQAYDPEDDEEEDESGDEDEEDEE